MHNEQWQCPRSYFRPAWMPAFAAVRTREAFVGGTRNFPKESPAAQACPFFCYFSLGKQRKVDPEHESLCKAGADEHPARREHPAAGKVAISFLLATLLTMIICMPRTFAYTISGVDLQTIARGAIERVLAERGETRRHEIFFTQPPADIMLPEGTVDVKADVPAQISYISLTQVRAVIYVNQRAYRTVNFTANIKVYDTVLVANHDLRIEVPVSPADFHTAEVVIDGRNEYVKNVAEVNGLVPHRFIRAGSPITRAYFQQPVAVNFGQRVNIILNYRGIRASAKGIVMSRGRIGSIVKVKNEASEKILTGKVIDAHTVEVSM